MEGATPLFWPLVRHRGGVKGDMQNDTFTLPSMGVAPSTLIPAGRLPGVEKGLWGLSVSPCSSVT